jgi:hypothetical protein
MTRRISSALFWLGGSFAAAAPALAGLQLGERPISRAEVIATVRKQFTLMDKDHDGRISPSEFAAYRDVQARMPDQGRGLTHIGKSWFERSDADGDGGISLSEAEDRPLQLFAIADANRDGVASVAEQRLAQLFVK